MVLFQGADVLYGDGRCIRRVHGVESTEREESSVLSMVRADWKGMMMIIESTFWLRACIPLLGRRMKIKVLLSQVLTL